MKHCNFSSYREELLQSLEHSIRQFPLTKVNNLSLPKNIFFPSRSIVYFGDNPCIYLLPCAFPGESIDNCNELLFLGEEEYLLGMLCCLRQNFPPRSTYKFWGRNQSKELEMGVQHNRKWSFVTFSSCIVASSTLFLLSNLTLNPVRHLQMIQIQPLKEKWE